MNGNVTMHRTPAAGFSLVEFMVALVLGTILIGGAISIYLAANRSYQETERSISMLDSGRFALQIMTDSLRHTGFFAGVTTGSIDRDGSLDKLANNCSNEADAYDLDTYLYAEVAGAGKVLGCLDDVREGTDVLVVKALIPDPLSDTADPNQPGDGVIDTPTGLDSDFTYVVANAKSGLLLDGADTPPLVGAGQAYAGARAWPYSYQLFYIQEDTEQEDTEQEDTERREFRLARKTLRIDSGSMDVVTESLAEGVEDMRLRFRYDSDGDGNMDTVAYAEDLNAADWDSVGSVEIFLLIRSPEGDGNYDNEKTYTLGDRERLEPNVDLEFYRLLLTRHIALRNPNLIIQSGGA